MLKCVLSGPVSRVFHLVMEEQTFHPHALSMSDFVLNSVQKYSVNTPPFSLVLLRFLLSESVPSFRLFSPTQCPKQLHNVDASLSGGS